MLRLCRGKGVRPRNHRGPEWEGHRPVRLLSGLGRRPGLLSERTCSPDRFHPSPCFCDCPQALCSGKSVSECLRSVCVYVCACVRGAGGQGRGGALALGPI